jgi:hypothetical protein
MPEAEAVLSGELRAVGTNQLPPDERGEPRGHRQVGRGECLHRSAVEDLALDRAPLEDRALVGVELVEACAQQRTERRRDVDRPVFSRHCQHLGQEERVAACCSGHAHPLLLR